MPVDLALSDIDATISGLAVFDVDAKSSVATFHAALHGDMLQRDLEDTLMGGAVAPFASHGGAQDFSGIT